MASSHHSVTSDGAGGGAGAGAGAGDDTAVGGADASGADSTGGVRHATKKKRSAARRIVAIVSATVASVLAALLLLASAARFEHARGPGAEQCPDAQAFAARVEEKLGRSPFDADAQQKVSVRFDAAEGDKLHATIERTGDELRILEESGADCAALADRAVAAVAELFSTPAETPAPPPPTMNVDKVPEPKREPSPVGPRFGAGILAGAGFAPTANFGVYLFGGIGFGGWSLDLEGRFDLPASEATRDYTVRTSLRVAQAVLCTRKGPAFGCALAGGGVLEASGENVNDARDQTFFHGHIGVRAGVESPIAGPLALRVAFDILVPITRTTIEVRGVEAWITQPFGFAFGAGPSLRF
jgi:hypothetical protein